MKKLWVLLSFLLGVCTIARPDATIAPQEIKKANRQFQLLKKELNAYIKCLNNDKNCDKRKLTQLKIVASIFITTTLATATVLVYRGWAKSETPGNLPSEENIKKKHAEWLQEQEKQQRVFEQEQERIKEERQRKHKEIEKNEMLEAQHKQEKELKEGKQKAQEAQQSQVLQEEEKREADKLLNKLKDDAKKREEWLAQEPERERQEQQNREKQIEEYMKRQEERTRGLKEKKKYDQQMENL